MWLMAKCGPALPSYARKSLILDGLMNQDEIVLFNLVDGCAARVMAQVRARIYLPRHHGSIR